MALANNGEIGSHDTRHDGRLFSLSNTQLAERLANSRKTLEKIAETPVVGFRAPLLQHSQGILRSLKDCDYHYDASIPTWEAKHPRTMRSHGIGTIFPTSIEGIHELPLTAIQDHQFLHVSGRTPKDLLTEWLSIMAEIKELGGFCVFLSHPEYAFLDTRDLSHYEELLNALSSDSEASVTCPKDIFQF
jgi:peptidoglycan/xylan/chitin deacetylase (PgdA/CDA1 family)